MSEGPIEDNKVPYYMANINTARLKARLAKELSDQSNSTLVFHVPRKQGLTTILREFAEQGNYAYFDCQSGQALELPDDCECILVDHMQMASNATLKTLEKKSGHMKIIIAGCFRDRTKDKITRITGCKVFDFSFKPTPEFSS